MNSWNGKGYRFWNPISWDSNWIRSYYKPWGGKVVGNEDFYFGYKEADWLGYRPYPNDNGTVFEVWYNKLLEPVIMKGEFVGKVDSFLPNYYPEDGVLDGKYYVMISH